VTTFDPATLAAIADSDDLHVSPFREDGTTYGTPTWIWSVVVGDRLFVRAYNGTSSRWYRAAEARGAGRVRAAGTEHEVTFRPAAGEVDDEVSAAYETKYHGSPYLPPMLTDQRVAATMEIAPR